MIPLLANHEQPTDGSTNHVASYILDPSLLMLWSRNIIGGFRWVPLPFPFPSRRLDAHAHHHLGRKGHPASSEASKGHRLQGSRIDSATGHSSRLASQPQKAISSLGAFVQRWKEFRVQAQTHKDTRAKGASCWSGPRNPPSPKLAVWVAGLKALSKWIELDSRQASVQMGGISFWGTSLLGAVLPV